MHIRSASFIRFKRFTDLTISGVPETAKLVVLTGPNGSGKSAIFEGLNRYRRTSGGFGQRDDPLFFPKTNSEGQGGGSPQVRVEFHEGVPETPQGLRKCFWIRSAYRHEADFSATELRRQGPAIDDPGLDKLILTEQTVKKNYERLSSLSLQAMYDQKNDDKRVADLREEHIGAIQKTMQRVFGDLILRSPVDPLGDGTFFFDKGTAARFHYKNLSAGEKAAFDLILDFHLRAESYDDTVFCIDEPELHLGSRVQGLLLASLFDELPSRCQLWVATHSLGMMRKAMELHRADPDHVAFLDTSGVDFDQPVTLTPVSPDRRFWRRTLEVALDDLAGLVAPATVVLCEGADPVQGFDANVYREIFAEEFPDAEFLSVGSSSEVKRDYSGVGSAIEIIAPSTRVLRVVDRDEHNEHEVQAFRERGIRVLERRNLECYLLDDEILRKLCETAGQPGRFDDAIAARDAAVADASEQGRAADDYKSARGAVQVFALRELGMRQSGSNADEFLRSTVAPLITSDTRTYQALLTAVFGE